MIRLISKAFFAIALLAPHTGSADPSAYEPPHIGRILLEGRDVCSGSLVSPSIVMTAAHCLQKEGSLTPVNASTVSFLIKSPEDGRRRIFHGIDIGIRPDFTYTSQLNPGIPALKSDLALLRLDGIATRSDFEMIGNPALSNGIAYIPAELAADRAPTGTETCLSKILDNGLLVLSCSRGKGFSGTPVFSTVNGKKKIIGIVAAKSERAGVPVLYAVIPHLTISDIVWRKGTPNHQMSLISGHIQD